MKKRYNAEATGVEAFVQKVISIAWKGGIPLVLVGTAVITSPLYVGNNSADEISIVQHITGTMSVHSTPGPFFKGLASTEVYPKVMTFDHDRNDADSGTTLNQHGISVRYQDGGMGTVFGISRYALPTDKETMLKNHRDFGSAQGLANKLIRPVVEEGMNLTAGLMKSENAYATERAIFTQMAKSQISNGPFKTILRTVEVRDEVTGKVISTQVPEPALDKNMQRIHITSDLKEYGISVVGFQLNDPGFEKSTMDQIAKKRGATMAVITAKANAELAKQTAITAEEDGKAAVMTAKYEEEILKERAVVAASRKAEVATIAAEQKVAVAKQALLEAEQRKLASVEYKEEQINIGTGEAERMRLAAEANGSLEQRLAAEVQINQAYAQALGKNKLVSEITMGSGSCGVEVGGNSAMDLIDMLKVKTATDLANMGSVVSPHPIK